MDGQYYTASEIAEIMGISKQAVIKRAKKESWPYANGSGNGGNHYKYCLPSLPSDIQTAIVAQKGAAGISPEIIPALAPEAALKLADEFLPIPSFADTVKISTAGRRRQSTRDSLPQGSGQPPAADSPSLYNNTEKREKPSPGRMAELDKAGRGYAALRKDKVRVKMQIIHRALKMPSCWTKGRRAWFEKVAEDHDISFQNLYKIVGRYEKGGPSALEHVKSTRGEPKTWDKEALAWWLGMALKQGHDQVSLKALYFDSLLIEAHRNHWRIGGLGSATWWYNKKASPQMLALQKGGIRALDNTLTPVMRDYSDLKPFEILCGDQHRFDFWVQDAETGAIFRPEAFIWQDLRTRVIYGAAVVRDYSAYTVGLALRMGVKIFGLFDSVYTDHGKPEESKYILNIRRELAGYDVHFKETVEYYSEIIAGTDPEEVQPLMRLPHQHIQAVVRNAKAKMQESTNNALEIILASKFRVPGHVKNLKADQEEQYLVDKRNRLLAESGKLLTFEEFVLRFYLALDYYNRQHNHRGVKKEWRWDVKPGMYTPFSCLQMCWRDGWTPRLISDATLEMVFLSRTERVPRLGMITFQNDFYESKELLELPPKQKVELRYDPLDPSWLAVFKDGQYLCTAYPVEMSSMKDLTLAQRKIMEKRKLRKAFVDQYRQLTTAVPDFIHYSDVPKEEKAAALLETDRKKKVQEQLEFNRKLTPEELESGVKMLEEMNRLPATSAVPRELPPKPSSWTSKALRHEWCLKTLAAGGTLSDEDTQWMMDYEAKMSPEARKRCEFEREYSAALVNGG